jgi:pentatricopeptide repeat protein
MWVWEEMERRSVPSDAGVLREVVSVLCEVAQPRKVVTILDGIKRAGREIPAGVLLEFAIGLDTLDRPGQAKAFLRLAANGSKTLSEKDRGVLLVRCIAQRMNDVADRVFGDGIDQTDLHPAFRMLWDADEQEQLADALAYLRRRGVTLGESDLIALVHGLLRAGRTIEALDAFDELRSRGAADNPKLYGALMDALGKIGRPDEAEAIFCEMLQKGLPDDARHHGSILQSFAREARTPDVLRVMSRMRSRGHSPNAIDYGAALAGILRSGDGRAALRLFDDLCADRIEWDARHVLGAMRACALLGDPGRAEALLRDMRNRSMPASAAHLAAVAEAHAGKRDWAKADAVLIEALAADGAVPVRAVGLVVEGLCGSGSPVLAENLVQRVGERCDLPPVERTFLYNLLLKGYGRLDRLADVNRVRGAMMDLGIPFDRYTISSVSAALERAGVMEAEENSVRGRGAEQWKELAILFDDVIHELNQPIGRVGLSIERLTNRLESGDDVGAREALERLRRAAQELGDRVEVYKALTRGRDMLTTFHLKQVVGDVCNLVRPQADRAGVEIAAHDDEGNKWGMSPCIRGDPFLFRLAVRGLVNNAIQALTESAVPPGKRRVNIVSAYSPPRQVNDPSDGWVELWVRDNGPGIPEIVRQRVFERGFTTRPGRGLGLGLSLVQSVAEAHGGRVRLIEETTPGAEFWLRVPAAAPEEE